MSKSLLIRLPLAIGAAVSACALSAQENPPIIEEVIVKAQKREHNIQDIGITMSAFTNEEIELRGLKNLQDVTRAVSNVELFEDYGGGGLPIFVIRGVGLQDFNANNTPTAAIYLDEVYRSSSAMAGIGLFDVEQVEVLKGPQGGLYGRNTSGGAVTVKTRRPVLGESSAYARVAHGRWRESSLEAAVNIPLSRQLGIRLSGRAVSSDSAWQKSYVTGQEHGEKDLWDFRGWLAFQPNVETDIQWKIYAGENRSEINLGRAIGLYASDGSFCEPVLAGFRDDNNCLDWAGVNKGLSGQPSVYPGSQSEKGSLVFSDPVNALNNDYWGTSLEWQMALRDMELVSISSYDIYNYGLDFDYDGSSGIYGHTHALSDIKNLSQEFRLLSPEGEVLEWLVGVSANMEQFFEDRTFLLNDNVIISSLLGLDTGLLSYRQDTRSYAMFAQLGYELSERLSFDAALRYSDVEKKYRNGDFRSPLVDGDDFYLFRDLASDYELGSRFTGKIGLNLKITEDALLYGSISRGFKEGGIFGGFPFTLEAVKAYKEETVWGYEAGIKQLNPDIGLMINAAAFYYDYRDVQGLINEESELIQSVIERLSNQGDAVHQGLEVDFSWSPGQNFHVSGTLAYLDARISGSQVQTTNIVREQVPVNGARAYSPRWSGNLALEYRHNYDAKVKTRYFIEYNYRSDFSGALSSNVDKAVKSLDGYGLVNGRIVISNMAESLLFSLFAENMTDEVYVPRVVYDALGSFIDIPGRPRFFGLSVEYQWR